MHVVITAVTIFIAVFFSLGENIRGTKGEIMVCHLHHSGMIHVLVTGYIRNVWDSSISIMLSINYLSIKLGITNQRRVRGVTASLITN